MKLVSDYSDYYDCIFNNSDDTEFVRLRENVPNKWDILSILYNTLEETVPMYGYPDSLLEDGLPMEALVYVYKNIYKKVTPRETIKVTLREALDDYPNKLCVEAIDNPDNIVTYVLHVNKHMVYFKFKGEELISELKPSKLDSPLPEHKMYLITYVDRKAVDLDTAPILKNTLLEKYLSIDTINNMLEYKEE